MAVTVGNFILTMAQETNGTTGMVHIAHAHRPQ